MPRLGPRGPMCRSDYRDHAFRYRLHPASGGYKQSLRNLYTPARFFGNRFCGPTRGRGNTPTSIARHGRRLPTGGGQAMASDVSSHAQWKGLSTRRRNTNPLSGRVPGRPRLIFRTVIPCGGQECPPSVPITTPRTDRGFSNPRPHHPRWRTGKSALRFNHHPKNGPRVFQPANPPSENQTYLAT